MRISAPRFVNMPAERKSLASLANHKLWTCGSTLVGARKTLIAYAMLQSALQIGYACGLGEKVVATRLFRFRFQVCVCRERDDWHALRVTLSLEVSYLLDGFYSWQHRHLQVHENGQIAAVGDSFDRFFAVMHDF